MTEEQIDKPTLKRVIPIPFFLPLAANTNQSISTDQIPFRYRVIKVEAHFRDDAANNLQVWAFVSRNRNTGTAPPADNKILGYFGATPYLVGEGEIVKVDCDVLPDESEKYIKVYFCNFNAYAMDGHCIVTIESLEGLTAEEMALFKYGTNENERTTANYTDELYKKGAANLEVSADILSGTDPRVKGLAALYQETSLKQSKGVYERYMENMNIPTYLPASVPKEDRYKFARVWFDSVKDLSFEMMNTSGLLNMLTSAFGGSITEWAKWFEEVFGLNSQMKKLTNIVIDKSFIPAVEQYWNSIYTPEYPDVGNLINMVVKEKISLETFFTIMKYQGYSQDWSQRIWDAHFIAPDFETAKRAYWRGGIKKDELATFMKLVDLDPFYNDKVWMQLIEEVPQYSDLINMRVKEVITQDTFKKGLEAQGYFGDWADRLWDAHFTPASFTDFLTAMRRKLTVNVPVAEGTPQLYTFGSTLEGDMEKIKELSILADYDPRYWDFFKTRMFNDPSYRMIMWGYEAGAIPLENVPDLVHRLGLDPVHEEWYTKFITTFQERPWVNRYLTTLLTAYVNGAITDIQLKQRVQYAHRNVEIANWMIRIGNVRKEIAAHAPETEKEQAISLSELKRMFIYGQLSGTDFQEEMKKRGYSEKDVYRLSILYARDKVIEQEGGKKLGLTVAELFNAFRYNELTEDELRSKLLKKGMDETEAKILINSKKKAWAMGGTEGGEQ